MPHADVTLAILAGGQGTRMGGPKSTLIIRGNPILQYLADRLQWPGPTLVITAPGNEHPPGIDAYDAEATDPVPAEGPLRGVLTAIDAARTNVIAVLTVDMPSIGPEHLDWFLTQLRPDDQAAMCSRTVNGAAQIEPFPLIIRRRARDLIAQRIAAGRRAVHALAEDRRTRVVPAPAPWGHRPSTNLNSPEDLAGFLNETET